MRKNAVFLMIGMSPCLVKKSGSFLKLIRMRTIRYNQHNQETNLNLSRPVFVMSSRAASRQNSFQSRNMIQIRKTIFAIV